MVAYCRVDDLTVACRLTACTPGSAPGPTLGIEYGKSLPFIFYHVHVRYMVSPVRLSSVCNACTHYSAGSNFLQYFYAIPCLGHPLISTENFTEIVPGEPILWGLNARGVAKYSGFGPIEGYIWETVQDRPRR